MATKLKKSVDAVGSEWTVMTQDELYYEWCCDCGLRHIHIYRIVKNRKGKLEIQRRLWRDDFATNLLREYEKKVEVLL